jgi:hypothetical protein
MSYRPASPNNLAGRYDNPMPELTLSPQSGSNEFGYWLSEKVFSSTRNRNWRVGAGEEYFLCPTTPEGLGKLYLFLFYYSHNFHQTFLTNKCSVLSWQHDHRKPFLFLQIAAKLAFCSKVTLTFCFCRSYIELGSFISDLHYLPTIIDYTFALFISTFNNQVFQLKKYGQVTRYLP